MKRYLKIILPIVLVVAIIITLIAVIGNPNHTLPAIQEVPKEEIFTKTIHDFAGYQIEQLTDEEDANFVVFAEGVKEIVVSKDTNILVETNYKKLSYTFRNADESLKSLKKDDVIFGRASQWNPEGVAAKVKKIKISGDTVTVFSQPIGLADMFVYADICMEASLANAFFDAEQLEEGSQIIIGNQSEESARGGRLESSSQSYGKGTKLAFYDGEQLKEDSQTVGNNQTGENAQDSELESGLHSESKYVNLTLSHSLNIKTGKETATGSLSLPTKKPSTIGDSTSHGVEITGTLSRTLHSITVEWRFDRETLQFYWGEWADIISTEFIEVSAYGQASEKYTFPPLTIPLNLMLSLKLEAYLTAEVSGSVSGSVRHSSTNRRGAKGMSSITEYKKEPIDTVVKPSEWEGSLEEMEAKLSVGFELKPCLQIGFIGKIYVSGWGGLTFSGSYDPKESASQEKKPDYIHDCDACIDGDINLGGKIDVGVEVNLVSDLKASNFDKEKLQISSTILEVSIQVGDFYISTMEEKTTFDFIECPNYRYKTTVNLVDEEGKAVGGAAVTADLGNGKTEEVVADEKGVATIYLPRGEASINASQKTQFAETTLDVQQASTIQLQLENNGFYIVELNAQYIIDIPGAEFQECSEQYQKLREMLSQKYPNAIFYNELSPEEKEKNPMEVGSLALSLSYTIYEDEDGELGQVCSYISLREVVTFENREYLRVSNLISELYYDSSEGTGTEFEVYANAVPDQYFDDHFFGGGAKWDFDYDHYDPLVELYEKVPLDTAIQRADQAVSYIYPFIDLHLKGKWNYDNLQVLFDNLS